MSIKRILVPLPESADCRGEIDIALAVGKAFGAHVQALFISEPLRQPTNRTRVAELSYGRTAAAAVAAVEQVNWAAEERDKMAKEAREKFAYACAVNSIPLRAASEEPGTLPAATWREVEGTYVNVAVAHAAAFDLVVAASAAVTETLGEIAEQSLLQTRRPVLLAPSPMTGALTDMAMIAWDESPECWHAVSAALPFLRLAKAVQIASIDRHADRRTASQAEVISYLACHDIAATARVVAPHLRSVGDTLLATAGDDIGLLVMGAYSHSRLREMLWGGATRHILKNAVARPVLLAH